MIDHPTKDQIFLSKLTGIILVNLSNENFGVKELTVESGMSPYKLRLRIHSITNKTIRQFINETRLQKAFEMLQDEGVTASEVAYKVGFGSPTYFNTCFHEFFGYTPGEVKKGVLKNTKELNPVRGKAKQKHKRFSLRTPILILSGIIILLIFFYQAYNKGFKNTSPKTGSNKERHEKSIAVLPFKNLSESTANQYFIDGLMDEILTNLSRIHDLRVISRTSVDQFRESTLLASEIGKKLNADYLVEGSGQKYGSRFSFRVQLIDASKDKHIWAKSYDKEIKETSDIIGIQSQVAQSIAAELKTTITPEEKQLIEKLPTSNLTAYDFYQRGKEEAAKASFDEKNAMSYIKKTEQMYRKALENDPAFAPAYAGLANVYWDKHWMEDFFSENYVDSVPVLCDIALSYDSQLSEAYSIKGDYYQALGKPELAHKEYDKALKYNPNDWMAYFGKGNLYTNYGDDYIKTIDNFQKAISLHRGQYLPSLLTIIRYPYLSAGFIEEAGNYGFEAVKLSGDSVRYYISLSEIETLSGKDENSIELLKKAYQTDSSDILILALLGDSYIALHQNDEALKYFKKCIEIDTTKASIFLPGYWVDIGWTYLQSGYKAKAEYYFNKQIENSNKLNELGRSFREQYDNYLALAQVYSVIGEKDKAYKNLKIYNRKKVMSLWEVTVFKRSPLFDGLRDEPEFQKIVGAVEAKYQAEHERVRKWLEEQREL